MKLSTPDADEVFNKWMGGINSKKLNKTFGIEKEAITVAENVKDVEKSAFLYFNSEILKKKRVPEGKEQKPEEVSVSKLKDITFYSFPSKNVDVNAWKGKDFVPMLKNLRKQQCNKCGGKGIRKCKKCNDSRFITCEDCKGKTLTCNKCNGTGKIVIELKVKEVNEKGDEKNRKEERPHQCPSCFGTGKITCEKCGGTNKMVCYECKGNPLACRDCNGDGIYYLLHDSPVPLLITPGKEYYSFMAKKDQWMLKDKEYNQKLESAEVYPINDTKNLNEKDLRELFGVVSLDKDIQKCIDETRKTYENLQKDYEKGKSSERPLKRISLVFLLRLNVVTPKNKKFDIYALGTKNRYSIMTNRF